MTTAAAMGPCSAASGAKRHCCRAAVLSGIRMLPPTASSTLCSRAVRLLCLILLLSVICTARPTSSRLRSWQKGAPVVRARRARLRYLQDAFTAPASPQPLSESVSAAAPPAPSIRKAQKAGPPPPCRTPVNDPGEAQPPWLGGALLLRSESFSVAVAAPLVHSCFSSLQVSQPSRPCMLLSLVFVQVGACLLSASA